MARLYCKHSNLLETALTGVEQDLLGLMAEGYDDPYICRTLHMDQEHVEDNSESIYKKFGINEGTAQERRLKAIQAFVEQIHKVPLSVAYDAVS